MEFRCRLASASGEIVEGVYVAESEARLRHDFEEKGLFVLSLQPKGSIAGVSFHLPLRQKVNTREFLVFNQELATLLEAGMPLVQSLDILRTRLTNPLFKSVLDDVHEKVRGGTALSDAFALHRELFPSVYTASLMAGERAGNLDSVLRRFVAYSKTVDMVRSRTISAMIYPVILIGLAVFLVGVIVVKVVPTFTEFYSSFEAELPLSTRMIVAISDFVRGQMYLILVALVAGGIAFFSWIRQPGHGVQFDRLLLKLPFLGSSFHKFSTSRSRAPWPPAGRRHSARQRDRNLGAGVRQPLHRARAGRRGDQGPRGAELRRHAARTQDRAGRGDQDDRSGRVDRRADRDAQQPRRFLR